MRLLSTFRRILYTLSIISFSTQAIPVENYTSLLPEGTQVGLITQPVGPASPNLNYHADQLALPASTQKVVTALAALLQLGGDYQFTTTMETEGKIKNDQLNGDLIFRFSGDPTLTRQQLRGMVAVLKQSGITKVHGDLLIDTSAFSSHDKAPGWVWNDMTQCFSAPPSAAIVDKNCFSVLLQSGNKDGDIATIRKASFYPVTVLSEVETYEKGSTRTRFCELDVTVRDLNTYVITGCIPKRDDAVPLMFSIQDGAHWAGTILKEELQRANIELDGYIKRRSYVKAPVTVLAQTQSKPLHNLLTTMLKESDNMIADTVFRTIGREYYGVAGTWRSGAEATRAILKQKAGIDLGNTVMVDGSGLSRHNLISPATMMQVLQYIGQHENELNFITMLPLSGHDGTLQYRGGFHEAGVDGKVSAKTGSLKGVYNLAGFMTTANGQKVAFVQYVSAYSPPTQNRNAGRAYLVRFETNLYKDMYNNR
ncbi:serine-type D-Ala-D-Ala carboxypeptidase [Proteus vulgaris]|uniref:serine-type D-Ala-D-Ala carboxypeptidase n=1 Tax=Proteus vulgaris TaxID=585 RepID=UPI00287577DA|nr:serine-type D-Ala-D-Ala carboxypeptidase [Proteus vulgaris]MDS0788239.1 serine-type D-Ala-D-Ala carboxypeptidase [Proteus vulgaris]